MKYICRDSTALIKIELVAFLNLHLNVKKAYLM